MLNVATFLERLAKRTHPELTPEWDPTGIQLGDAEGKVESVAVCHEVTEEVVAAVENEAVDLLVTYHPLLFHPTTSILAGRSAGARAFRLIGAGVNLVVTHTDFDACEGGAADALAQLFSLRDVESFGADDEKVPMHIGRVGNFEGTLGTVDAVVSDAFGHVGVRVSGDREQIVERVAVVPGSGSGLVARASLLADVLVTGDVSHHSAVRAMDLGLSIVDPGHSATERPGMKALVEMISDITALQAVDLTEFDPQTWS